MTSASEIGLMIQRARTRKRLTQEELADIVGSTRATVSNWERGVTLPVQFTGAIEAALEITIPPFGNQVPA